MKQTFIFEYEIYDEKGYKNIDGEQRFKELTHAPQSYAALLALKYELEGKLNEADTEMATEIYLTHKNILDLLNDLAPFIEETL